MLENSWPRPRPRPSTLAHAQNDSLLPATEILRRLEGGGMMTLMSEWVSESETIRDLTTTIIKLVRPKSITPLPHAAPRCTDGFRKLCGVRMRASEENETRGGRKEGRSQPSLPLPFHSIFAQIAKLVFVFSSLPFRG